MILHTVDKLYSVNWFFSWSKKKIETRWTTGGVSRTYLRAQKYGFKRILEMRSGITTLSDLLRQKNQKCDWLTFFLSPNRTSSTYSSSEYHVEPNKMFRFEVHGYIYCEDICWGKYIVWDPSAQERQGCCSFMSPGPSSSKAEYVFPTGACTHIHHIYIYI